MTEPKPIGPTRETMRHGDYVKPEGQSAKGGLAVYTNRHANRLGMLKGREVISPRQWAAGLAFEETWVRCWGSPSPSRDSTMQSLGGTVHETQTQAERIAKSRACCNTILNRIGPQRYSLLVAVCCFGEGLGTGSKGLVLRKLLCESLDQCAIVYGIGKEVAA